MTELYRLQMNSKSKHGDEAERTTSNRSMHSAVRGSEQDGKMLKRCPKVFGLTDSLTVSTQGYACAESEQPLRGKAGSASSDHLNLLRPSSSQLDPKKEHTTVLDRNTVTNSVLKALANNEASSSQSSGCRSATPEQRTNLGVHPRRPPSGKHVSSSAGNHCLPLPSRSRSNPADVNAYFNAVDSCDLQREMCGTADLGDLGIPEDQMITRDINKSGPDRTARESIDITQMLQNVPDDGLFNASHPILRNASARINLRSPDTLREENDRKPNEYLLGELKSLREYCVGGNSVSSSSETEIRTIELGPEPTPSGASDTSIDFPCTYRGTRSDPSFNVERGSEGRLERWRSEPLVRSTNRVLEKSAARTKLEAEDDDCRLHPYMRHFEAGKDRPAAPAHKLGSSDTLRRVINSSDGQSWETEGSLGNIAAPRSKFHRVVKKSASENDNPCETNLSGKTDEAQKLTRSESSPVIAAQSQSEASKSKEKQVNFMFRTSEFDLIYSQNPEESQEESPIHPGIVSPTFSAADIAEKAHPFHFLSKDSDLKDIFRPQQTTCTQDGTISVGSKRTEIFVANTKQSRDKDSATDSPSVGDKATLAASFEVQTVRKTDSEPSSASSLSVAATASLNPLEAGPHTGSAYLIENLPKFGRPHTPQADQEQQEVEEEIPKLATRSGRSVPPMDFSLNEWDSIVKILKMNEPVSVQRVLCRLSKMATKRHSDLVWFYKCGLYDNALSLLLTKPDVPLIQNLTLKMIAELSCLPECRTQILDSPQLIIQCITLLEDDNSSQSAQEYSSKILSAIAKNKSVQLDQLLQEHDMIEVLLRRIINTPDPDVRCNCMEMMLHMANDETTCKSLIQSEQFTLDLFTSLVGNGYSKIQQLALGMLELLTKYETEQAFLEKVQESGVAELMIDVLKTDNMRDFSKLVLAILSNIANTEFGVSILRQSKAVKFLVNYIDQEGKEDLLAGGLEIVVKVSVIKAGRAYLVEFEVPTQLVRYLKNEDDTALERTCAAIANMAENPEALSTIVACDPAENLTRLIYEDKRSSQLKYAASRALFQLAARDEIICQKVAELHLPEVFHHIFWSGCIHVQTLEDISDTIQVLSRYPDLKSLVINDDSVACFLDIMQGHTRPGEISDKQTKNEEAPRIFATQCLRCYMSDPRCREMFSHARGVFVLKNNLESSSIPLRQATAVLIDQAAKDPQLAFEMVVAGIVQIMLSDMQMMAACPAWHKALNQIFSHHLPTKFAYCRRLDITDITADGFYIAATQKGPIEVLDILLHERKCPLEAIYLCNFSIERPQPQRPLHILMSPVSLPYTRQDPASYPEALSGLAERSVAATWRHKLSVLSGDQSPSQSRENSLELTPNGSHNSSHTSGTKGSNIETRTSSFNRRPKTRKNKSPKSSLESVHSNGPRLSDPENEELNQRLEVYRVCPVDQHLGKYLKRLRFEILNHLGNNDEGEVNANCRLLADNGISKVVEIIAKFVADRMSGNTNNMPNLGNFFALSMKELKDRGETNIFPVGHLKTGLHLERALLFKVLADKIGMPCSLVRGEYGIAYNEVCVPCLNNKFPVKPNYIVDLMCTVGCLYFVESREAFAYRHAPY